MTRMPHAESAGRPAGGGRAWPSTISTRRPATRVVGGHRVATGRVVAAAGSVTVTVVPTPGVLAAVTVPPISAHSRRQMASPRPVPP